MDDLYRLVMDDLYVPPPHTHVNVRFILAGSRILNPNALPGLRVWAADKFRSMSVIQRSSTTRRVQGHRVMRVLPEHFSSATGFNISACSNGIPYAISRPLKDSIPSSGDAGRDGSGDESFWDVEPRSGTTLSSKLARQLNMWVEAGEGKGPLRSMVVPLAWGEEVPSRGQGLLPMADLAAHG